MRLSETLRAHRPHYSKLILLGLEKQVNSATDILRSARVSQTKALKILDEKASLTQTQLAVIENATGQSAGQLALLGGEMKDRQINKLMDSLAAIRFDRTSSPRAAKHA